MNAIVNQLLLAGNKFMPKIHLRLPCFAYIYSACGPFTKNKEQKKYRNWRFKINLSKQIR